MVKTSIKQPKTKIGKESKKKIKKEKSSKSGPRMQFQGLIKMEDELIDKKDNNGKV